MIGSIDDSSTRKVRHDRTGNLMNVGDKVKHPDHPGATGKIKRIVYVGPQIYYKVVWEGRTILYPVYFNALKVA